MCQLGDHICECCPFAVPSAVVNVAEDKWPTLREAVHAILHCTVRRGHHQNSSHIKYVSHYYMLQ